MEGDEVTQPGQPSEKVIESDTPFSDMLDQLCPYFMAMGVSYDEFWNGDYTQLKYVQSAYLIETERRNEQAWLQGMYVYEAVGVALSNAFKKKGTPPEKYPEKPFRLTPLTEIEKEAENKRIVAEFRNKLLAFGKQCEARHKREKGNTNGS